MAPITRKRKFASNADNAIPITPNTRDHVHATTLQRTSEDIKRRKRGKIVTMEPSEGHPAATFKTPNNPRATFEGLPAELRLQIYDHLCDSTIIHVHNRAETNIHDINSGHGTKQPYTWTPCRSPNPKSPLLCANPKWSGMCKEEDRCHYNVYAPPEPRGVWALVASNKQIRNEAHELFLRNAVISIHPHDLKNWLDYVEKHAPGQLEHVRRLTFAGRDMGILVNSYSLEVLRERVPNLEGVGVQCQAPMRLWLRSSWADDDGGYIDSDEWKEQCYLKEWMQGLDASVTIAIEAMVWQKKDPTRGQEFAERQIAVRLLREGKADGDGGTKSAWNDDDVQVEIDQPGELAAPKRNAKWRGWWRNVKWH